MILLDPVLGPDLEPDSAASARKALGLPSGVRLPSSRTLAQFVTRAQRAVRLRGQVSVLLTSDPGIRRLNRRFRDKDQATDVLSFPAERSLPGSEKMAGDLAISVPTAFRQAAEQGHTLAMEIRVLLLHGLLHLAGYDHEIDQGQMARLELKLRGQLGLPQGLIERQSNRGKAKLIRGSCPDSARLGLAERNGTRSRTRTRS
jgi:probable rRNA maturation factor